MHGLQTSTQLARAAIAGNPNSGKTSLFNVLTGSVHCVGNYPGVTVERTEGLARLDGRALLMIDLPGTYSLTAYSAEEVVARNFLINEQPDVVLDVVDASNLERNLYLTVQLMEMEVPLVIALNMIDIARRHGERIDVMKMSRLLDVPVVATVGNKGEGTEAILAACRKVASQPEEHRPARVTYGHPLDEHVQSLAAWIAEDDGLCRWYHPRWLAIKLIEKDPEVTKAVAARADGPEIIAHLVESAIHSIETHSGDDAPSVVAEGRYGFAAGILRQCAQGPALKRRRVTDRIDSVVCHRFVGPLILAAVVYGLFTAVFHVADEWAWLFGRSPTAWIELAFEKLAAAVSGLAATSPMLHSILADGVIGGVGGVLSFVPLIFTMFVFVAVLEDTGYVARVAFVMDRALRAFGLQGRSILAMIVSGGLGGGGCAVPGIMATRTMRDEKDRLITMMVAPMMNCGAKLPVYLMLIAAFFAAAQAKVMFLLWAGSWMMALTAGWLLRRLVIRGEQTPFVMELPSYHVPTVRGVLRHSWQRTWMYIRKAGTIILAISLVMWALMYFPRLDTSPYDARIAALEAAGNAEADQIAAIEAERSEAQLRHSIAGRVGTVLHPLSKFAGFDWRDNVALVGGFAAKEVIIGTLGVAYSMGDVDPEESESLADRLAADRSWSPRRACAMLVFVMIYAPCMSTLAVIRRESGSWKWTFFATAYTTTLAFILAVLVYTVGGALGLGGAAG